MNLPEKFYTEAVLPEITGDLQGGFLFIESNSSVTSIRNVYRNARAIVGGCVAFMAESEGSFTKDSF